MTSSKLHLAVLFCVISATLCGCSRTSESKSAETESDTTATDQTTVSQDKAMAAEYDYESLFKLESYLIDSAVAEDSIQVIDSDCAFIVYPTSVQIDAMIAEYGEEDFYTIADDNSYYQATALQKIDSIQIKTVKAELPFARFKGVTTTWTLDLRRKGLPEWNLILFNHNKEPQIISAIDLTTDHVKEYFQSN
ncbi:MAG TPA: hypothetical protein VGD65_18485 [Chryseosolibacter sp.]